jgi:hypothetical protein
MRQFDTGATRNLEADKPDYEGFLSPDVLIRFGQYMHEHRKQADGQMRESDNWQKGIPKDVYMKSMFRHFITLWKHHRQGGQVQEELCALMFNVMGYLAEDLKAGRLKADSMTIEDFVEGMKERKKEAEKYSYPPKENCWSERKYAI